MKIFYLNCFRTLKNGKNETTPQREWLINYVCKEDIDIICLSESSNYNLRDSLPEKYPYSYIASQPSLGYGFNICAKEEFSYLPISFDLDNATVKSKYKADLYDNRIIELSTNGTKIVVVHIPHETAFNAISLSVLLEYLKKNKPPIVTGDFNCGYFDDSLDFLIMPNKYDALYTQEVTFFKQFEDLGYINLLKGKNEYTYVHKTPPHKRFRIDHTFTLNNNVTMEYINTLENGFDHKGMLITSGY